jgi:integrase
MRLNRLSQRKIETARPTIGKRKDGRDVRMLADGGGLYLQIVAESDGTINRSWIFRFATGKTKTSKNGKVHNIERQMGLGSLDTISLAEAREKALKCRKLRDQGIDPIEARRAERANAALEASRVMTFDQCRDAFVAAKQAGWRNVKHASQWRNTLTTYVTPVFGKVSVGAIDTALVTTVLQPLWTRKPETARRVRGRIEAILDWAKACGYRDGENPARFRGHLKHLLADIPEVRRVKHHAALPYAEIAEFVADLRARPGIAAKALEFTILTAARTGEVIGARWDEINLKSKVWTVPAGRMKGEREHRVALTDAAVAVLEAMRQLRQNEFVFPGDRRAMMSNMAMEMLLRRMGRAITVHGFRSTFRDWAAERTNFPSEVAEAALAHVVGDKVEAAYRRGDLFEKRRRLMEAWAEYCTKAPAAGTVTALRSAR